MGQLIVYLLFSLLVIPFLTEVYAQEIINVNQTSVCFLNMTAGYQMLQNCNARDDWLKWATLPFEWVTGGWFSMILIGVIIIGSYLKYHKTVLTMTLGIISIPIAYALFPSEWITMSLILVIVAIAALIYKGIFKQTKEY